MARANLDRMMRILLPYLLRQRQQSQYLEESSAQYEQLARLKNELYSRSQKEIQDRAAKNEIVLQLLKTGKIKAEQADLPIDEILFMASQAGMTHPALPLPVSPELRAERKRPYEEMMARKSAVLERGEYLPKEEVGPATGLFGSKRMMDFLEQAERTRAGKEERGLRAEELEIKRAEVGIKGEKKTKKQLEDEFKVLDQKEKTFKAQLDSIGVDLGLTVEELKMSDDPKAVDLRAKLDEVWKRKLNNCSQRLGDLDRKKADGIISDLRMKGINAIGVEANKQEFMKEANLTEEEYQYIILSLR